MIYAWNKADRAAYRVQLTPSMRRKYGHMNLVSIGFVIGQDVTQATVDGWVRRGIATPADYDEAMHGGCQSGCVRRGDAACRW